MYIKTNLETDKLIRLHTLEISDENLAANKSTHFFQVVKTSKEKGVKTMNKVEVAINNTDIPSTLLIKLLKTIDHWVEERQSGMSAEPFFNEVAFISSDFDLQIRLFLYDLETGGLIFELWEPEFLFKKLVRATPDHADRCWKWIEQIMRLLKSPTELYRHIMDGGNELINTAPESEMTQQLVLITRFKYLKTAIEKTVSQKTVEDDPIDTPLFQDAWNHLIRTLHKDKALEIADWLYRARTVPEPTCVAETIPIRESCLVREGERHIEMFKSRHKAAIIIDLIQAMMDKYLATQEG